MKKQPIKELNKLIIAGPNTFTPEIIKGLGEYGIVVVACENPDKVRVLTDVDSFKKDDIIRAMAEIMTSGTTPDHVKASFVENFFEIIKNK